jgi:hypothetical protein
MIMLYSARTKLSDGFSRVDCSVLFSTLSTTVKLGVKQSIHSITNRALKMNTAADRVKEHSKQACTLAKKFVKEYYSLQDGD